MRVTRAEKLMNHDHSSPGVEGQANRSRSKVKTRSVRPRVGAIIIVPYNDKTIAAVYHIVPAVLPVTRV